MKQLSIIPTGQERKWFEETIGESPKPYNVSRVSVVNSSISYISSKKEELIDHFERELDEETRHTLESWLWPDARERITLNLSEEDYTFIKEVKEEYKHASMTMALLHILYSYGMVAHHHPDIRPIEAPKVLIGKGRNYSELDRNFTLLIKLEEEVYNWYKKAASEHGHQNKINAYVRELLVNSYTVATKED